MKHKARKSGPPQQQQQQVPPQSQAPYTTKQPASHALYGVTDSPGSSSSSTSQGLGFAARPATPPFHSTPAAAASSSTGGPSTQSAATPFPAAAAAQLYADPRISPRDWSASVSNSSSNVPAASSSKFSAGSSSMFSAGSSSGLHSPLIVGPISLGRPPGAGLAARIQAAELSAAGTFDPASWAAAAAEAVQADKQAAAAAARRAAAEDDQRRRIHAQETAAAALAAGRVSGAARASTGGGAGESSLRISPPAHQQQQQKRQQLLQQAQQQQSGASGSGWLTPTGSTQSTPAAAAAAAALAAATASYTGKSSPSQIASEYVELQRQQQQQQSSALPARAAAGNSSGTKHSRSVQGYQEGPTLREQFGIYKPSAVLPQQQQQHRSSPRRSPRPHTPQVFDTPPHSQSLQPLQQLPSVSAAAAAAAVEAGSPRASSGRASPTSWRDMMFDQGGQISATSSAQSLPTEYIDNVQPQLPPIRTVPPTVGPEVQPEGSISTGYGSAMLPAVLPGHYQDQPGYPEQYRLSRSTIPGDPEILGLDHNEDSGRTSSAVENPYQQPQQQYQVLQQQQEQERAVPDDMFVPVKAGTGMIGKLLGVQPVSPAGEAPTPAAAAAAELERLPSSSEQDAQPQSPPTAAAPAAAETKAAAAAGDKAAKRRKLLCIAVPLLMIFLGLGVGLGVGLGTRRQQQLAAVPERLTFSVTVEAPTSNSAVSCAKWFGTRQRLYTYQTAFVSSYASALDIPQAQFKIISLQCGGNDMTSPSASAAPTRHLLSATAAAAAATEQYVPQPAVTLRRHLQQSHSKPTPGTTDVATVFSLPSPASAEDRARLIANIATNSDKILQDSLGSVFGQPITVKSAVNEAARPQLQGGTGPQLPPSSNSQAQTAAGPPPLPRVTVPAPAVPSGVPVILPLNESRPAAGTAGDAPASDPNSGLGLQPVYDTASTCSAAPTVGNSVVDTQGNMWGWEHWRSCVFRGYTSVQTERVDSAWEQAPSCKGQPKSSNSVLDNNGMQWGWENRRSCAFRTPGWKPRDQQPQPLWQTAPACEFPPNKYNSVTDTNGNLWGWQGQQSCAFKGRYSDTDNEGYVRWDAAQTCRGSPTVLNSVADVDGRLWGWQGMTSCAYRPQS